MSDTVNHLLPDHAGAILPPNTQRWVKSRKLAILNAIESGALTDDQACMTYGLTQEELDSWRKALQQHGPGALRTTHINRYRKTETGEHR